MKLLQGGGDGANWGLDFDGEAEIQAYQSKLDFEGDGLGDDEEGDQDYAEDMQLIRSLDIELLEQRRELLTDKQRTMVGKIQGLRRKMMRQNQIGQGDSDAMNQRHGQTMMQLEQEEERLRTSLKSSKAWRKSKRGDADDSDGEGVGDDDDDEIGEDARRRKKLAESGDESDEFYDRTKLEPVSGTGIRGKTDVK